MSKISEFIEECKTELRNSDLLKNPKNVQLSMCKRLGRETDMAHVINNNLIVKIIKNNRKKFKMMDYGVFHDISQSVEKD
jgi:hypothetical protein